MIQNLLPKARQIVIELFQVTSAEADDVLAGEWDDTPLVVATLAALESVLR